MTMTLTAAHVDSDHAFPPHSPGRVAEKVILISGGAQGMGASHAEVLTYQGAQVMIADLQKEKADETARRINTLFNRDAVATTVLDVTDLHSWEATVKRTVEHFGQLDVLVNNAGIFTAGSAATATVEDWQKTIDIDLTGTFYGMKAAISELAKRQTSSIINISSIAGLTGFKNRAAYAAAKWGVQGLTKTSAMDLAPEGIRVNSIHPGSVETPLTEGLQRGLGQIPQNRAAKPQEISSMVVYLASDESLFVNGASIPLDGGETAGNNLREDS